MNPIHSLTANTNSHRSIVENASDSRNLARNDAMTSSAHLNTADFPQPDHVLCHLNQNASCHPAIRTVTVDDIREAFKKNGLDYSRRGMCSDQHILNRLAEINLSLDNYLCAIKIVTTPHHPIKKELGIPEHFKQFLLVRLSGLIRNPGLCEDVKIAAIHSDNNPRCLLKNILAQNPDIL